MFQFYIGYQDGQVSEIDFEMKSTDHANIYRLEQY